MLPDYRRIQVRPGDSVSQIATNTYGQASATMLDLMKMANPSIRDIDIISVGQELRLPQLDQGLAVLQEPDGQYALLVLSTPLEDRAREIGRRAAQARLRGARRPRELRRRPRGVAGVDRRPDDREHGADGRQATAARRARGYAHRRDGGAIGERGTMIESREWYVVRSKPRREEYAQGQLLRRGVETFLPRIVEPLRGHLEPVVAPMFPGYLFARIDLLTQYNSVIWAPGVRRFVSFGDVPAAVDRAVVSSSRTAAVPRAWCASCRLSTTAIWCVSRAARWADWSASCRVTSAASAACAFSWSCCADARR